MDDVDLQIAQTLMDLRAARSYAERAMARQLTPNAHRSHFRAKAIAYRQAIEMVKNIATVKAMSDRAKQAP